MYIIDEASMLGLELMAALFRAINFRSSVQRLILVGDQNQLPPIGRGRVFADIMDWLADSKPESVAVVTTNIREMANRIKKRGTGILELASVFERTPPTDKQSPSLDNQAEEMLRRLQDGGDMFLLSDNVMLSAQGKCHSWRLLSVSSTCMLEQHISSSGGRRASATGVYATLRIVKGRHASRVLAHP